MYETHTGEHVKRDKINKMTFPLSRPRYGNVARFDSAGLLTSRRVEWNEAFVLVTVAHCSLSFS